MNAVYLYESFEQVEYSGFYKIQDFGTFREIFWK